MRGNKNLLLWISGSLVAFFFAVALFAPIIVNRSLDRDALFPIVKQSPDQSQTMTLDTLAAPTGEHFFGTDYIGRDVFARLTHGIKNSLFFSMLVVLAAVLIGTSLGAVMGFYGGRFDFVVSRMMELVTTFPTFLLQLTLLAFFSQSYGILFFVMMLKAWIPYCRFARAEFFKLRRLDFVQAAEAMGCSQSRMIFRHLLPNSLSPILCTLPFDLSGTIIALGALSFLGFGEPLHVASVGELLKQAEEHFQQAWWLAVFPGGFLFMLTVALALFGSALRDLLDPREA